MALIFNTKLKLSVLLFRAVIRHIIYLWRYVENQLESIFKTIYLNILIFSLNI